MRFEDKRIVNVRASDGSTVKIEYREALPSTLELARKYAREGYPDRYVVFTERQASSAITGTKLSEGEYEHGVFISCILRPAFFPAQAGLVGHLSAVALVTALEEHTTKPLGLGWVSDVYCDGVRIGGCAVEGKLDSHASYEYMIVTLAVRLDNDNFPPRLTDMVRKVFESDNDSIPMIIAKTVLNKFFAAYISIKNPGKYMDAYSRKFLLYDKKIKYRSGDKRRRCRVVDVDKQTGLLIVETRQGVTETVKSPSLVTMPKKIKIERKK
jgi:BirA family biotin operon repressor/biotin-[acetyl-CoA-carboxylase] ligase